jgi:uncharacterized iron-regulated protein
MFWILAFALQAQPATQATPTLPPDHPPINPVVLVSYIPERVYDSDRKRFTDFEVMLAELARADVVLVGEQHDDRNTHRLEVALLEGLMRRRPSIAVSLEMFERDAQAPLSDYLSGTIAEAEFLKASRPWPRYASDYRGIVEFAKAHEWPVIASNVPRRLAAAVAKEGMGALDALPETDRSYVAASIECPRDEYRERFIETMNEHPAPGAEKLSAEERDAVGERYYFAQCVKDETMAEAIAAAHQPGGPLVVHYNGAFHSDFHAGVTPRVKRRLQDARIAVLTILPVEEIDRLDPKKDDRKRADYLVYTLKPRPSPHTK